MAPMKAAARCGELGADSMEMAQQRYGIMDKPDRELAPFKLPCIPLNDEDSLVMPGVIEERLEERIWKELSENEAGKCLYVSREFTSYNADSKPRSVADLSHLSGHYDPIVTKSDTLERFSASLLPNDHVLSMDLRYGFHHFRLHPDMRKFFSLSERKCRMADRYFQYLMLPFGWSRSGYWFSRLVQRFWTMVKRRNGYRVLSYVDDFAVAPSCCFCRGLQEGIEAAR
jgi:hypothetical protein